MKRYLLDTNVVLRFLLDDEQKLSAQAKKLFRQAEGGSCLLVLTDVAVAEAVWVLTSFYKVETKVVSETLASLIEKPGIRCSNAAVILDALRRFRETTCDFLDCYLAAQAVASGDGVASFDRDFRKFADVELWNPAGK
jgi:predicted nucleic-acid-binding protein